MIILLAALIGQAYEIQGEGYFRLERGEAIVYARSGSFEARDGILVHDSGLRLSPPVRITSAGWRIAPDGRVLCGGRVVSEIVIARFEGAAPKADGKLFVSKERPTLGNPGDPGYGVIVTPKSPEVPAFAPVAATVPVIVVRDLTEISTPDITIGQIADITGPEQMASRLRDVSLGTAPVAGEERVITRVTLLSALRDARLDPTIGITIGSRAVVRRLAKVVKPEEIEQFAREWLTTNMPDVKSLTLATQLAEKRVPDGEIVFKVTTNRDLKTAVLLTIEAAQNGKPLFNSQLVFNKQSAPSAATTPGGIKTGTNVRVLLVSNGVTVETTGKVTAMAADGTVTVIVEETKATLIGTLRADGTVEVKL